MLCTTSARLRENPNELIKILASVRSRCMASHMNTVVGRSIEFFFINSFVRTPHTFGFADSLNDYYLFFISFLHSTTIDRCFLLAAAHTTISVELVFYSRKQLPPLQWVYCVRFRKEWKKKCKIRMLSSFIVIVVVAMRNIVRVHRGTMALWESPKIKLSARVVFFFLASSTDVCLVVLFDTARTQFRYIHIFKIVYLFYSRFTCMLGVWTYTLWNSHTHTHTHKCAQTKRQYI